MKGGNHSRFSSNVFLSAAWQWWQRWTLVNERCSFNPKGAGKNRINNRRQSVAFMEVGKCLQRYSSKWTIGSLISCIFIRQFWIWLLNATKLGSKAMCLHDHVPFHNTETVPLIPTKGSVFLPKQLLLLEILIILQAGSEPYILSLSKRNQRSPSRLYLCLKTFHQDSNQQIKENVIPKCHEGNEVESGPGRGRSHAIVEDFIPVFLGQYLEWKQEPFDVRQF